MSDTNDTQRGGFTFIWKIENFSFVPRLSKNNSIESPVFDANNASETKWFLLLQPPGYAGDKENTFCFYLVKVWHTGTNCASLSYELSIVANDGSIVKSETVKGFWFHQGNIRGTPLCITPREIFSRKEILPGDTLTVRCKISYHDWESGFNLARTRIGVVRAAFTWTLDNFSDLKVNDTKTISGELQSNFKLAFTMALFLTGTPTYEEKVRIKFEGSSEETSDLIIILGISVQNINGKVVHHSEDEFKLSNEKKEWAFPLILEKKLLESNKDLLLPNDTLSLKCVLVASKFDLSKAIVLNEIESATCGHVAPFDMNAANTKRIESPSLGNEGHPRSNSLTNDMRHLLEDKYLTDTKIRVRKETFPVHRAILGARSSVFRAMFDTDMREKINNVVEIDDFDPNTVRRLVEYMYSEVWNSDIEWENASTLYFAAEKYAVVGLKEKCSSFLKMNLNVTNVCEILLQADLLVDEDLENFALSFIQENDKDVLNSKELERFSEKHPQLTVKILSRLYRNVKDF